MLRVPISILFTGTQSIKKKCCQLKLGGIEAVQLKRGLWALKILLVRKKLRKLCNCKSGLSWKRKDDF